MKKKQISVSSMSEKSLEEQALTQLNSGHYKEAIGLYKKLWQDSDNDEWRQQIAYCYLQRALTFAARGMVKEALVLWENYSHHAQEADEAIDHYIVWLIQANNQAGIQAALAQLTVSHIDKQYPDLAALLGLLMMTDYPQFQQYLPQDSSLIVYFNIVQTALQAYQDNDLESLNEALKRLPYRSAFRDFCSLFKAVIAVPTSIEQAQALIAKIPANSPYSQAAALLLACTHEGSTLVQHLLHFSHKQRRIIGEIKGLNKKQLEFIEQLCRQHGRLTDKVKFKLAIQYQSLCGSEFAERFCQALLADYPAGRRNFNKNFTSFNEYEENRLRALTCERDNKGYDAEYYWQQCINILSREETDNGLKIALILRHIAGQHENGEEQTELLIESLQHDPEDRDSYLQILRFFCQQPGFAREYKEWLTRTIEKFPQDIDVLTQVIKTAARNKAYKKASQYALKILKVDPLNTFAKQVLFTSYLAHARRLIQSKKYHLVEKEIQQAEDLNLGKAFVVQTQLMRGLFCFAEQDKKRGLQLIAESLNKLNSDPVNARFQATMEALLTGLPVATVLRELPVAKNHLLSVEELNRFNKLLKQYSLEDGNRERLHKSLEKIKSVLKKSLQEQDYDENQLLTLCQLLDDIHHFELLRHCSKFAFMKWKKPIWMYYWVFSETNGNAGQCSYVHVPRLQMYLEKAREEKDYRAMALIDNYLDRYYQANPQQNMGFFDDLFGQEDDEEDFNDPLDDLFARVPENVLLKLDKKIESLTKKISPEKLIQQLNLDNSVLLAMMQDPDLFMALMVVIAAEKTSVDIGVSVDDVLVRFGITKNTDPVTF